ncbi:MAG: Rieske (2Fe-2S) protein [Thaumarchaeota archaeon]|nr:Rieske (2Fe-2S) protein [Nitrososphaerota archaeon]
MSADGFEKIADVSEIQPGAIKVAKVAGSEVWVANIEGAFFAHPNKCTHAGGPVGKGKLNGPVIQCPWHGSKFDVRTGEVVGPPAKVRLPSLEVKLEGNAVLVRVV